MFFQHQPVALQTVAQEAVRRSPQVESETPVFGLTKFLDDDRWEGEIIRAVQISCARPSAALVLKPESILMEPSVYILMVYMFRE